MGQKSEDKYLTMFMMPKKRNNLKNRRWLIKDNTSSYIVKRSSLSKTEK